MGTQVEELVSQFEQFLDEQDYTSAIALITGTPEVMESDNLTKQLAYQFARSLIVERFVGMDKPHELVDLNLFYANETEFGEEFAIDTTYNGRLTFLPWFIQWRSYTILVRLEVFESGNPFLAELSNCMPNYEGSIYNAESLQQASELNPGFLANARRWCLETLKDEFVYYDSAFGENEFLKQCRTGSWYSFSNLNFISQEQLSSPCASCGETLIICEQSPCRRAYFSGHTSFNAEIDVVACESETEELDGFEKILIAVSVFGGEVMGPLATRTPMIEGILNLYKNDQDGKVRLLLGDARLDDWQGNSVEEGDFEVFESEFCEITHPLLAEGEYLVVSWRNAAEVGDETCFLWGLYRENARKTIEQALK
jgi:hypothetical protein